MASRLFEMKMNPVFKILSVKNTIIAFLIVITCYNTYSFTYGTYCSNNGTCVILDESTAIFKYRMDWDSIYSLESICAIKNVGCDFIEISSIDLDSTIYDGISIEYYDAENNDCCSVEFVIPNLSMGYKVYINTGKDEFFGYTKSNKCIMQIPINKSGFGFSIQPISISQDFFNGLVIGNPQFLYDKIIPFSDGTITITIPNISPDYFQQWKIKDEYIKILNPRTVEWRGYTYQLQ